MQVRKQLRRTQYYITALIAWTMLPGVFAVGAQPVPEFPYEKAGLTERQAAAHLLNRFTYGATPEQVDNVRAEGLEKWFRQQLNGGLPDKELEQLLRPYHALGLSNTEALNTFPKIGHVKRLAMKEGIVDEDSAGGMGKQAYKRELRAFMEKKGFRPERELVREFVSQKILRAAYTNNQLQEVLTEFWFNHFNVSFSKGSCTPFIPAYERDVIRANALGNFETLLLATAKSPAMLLYLDNFNSTGINSHQAHRDKARGEKTAPRKMKGLNENYAREVMELHTLGVDGGYTQHDVTQAARILTGWTIYPMGQNDYGSGLKKMMDEAGDKNLKARGIFRDGDFLFVANRHDDGEKTVLGKKFKAGGGYEEGVALLKLLAHHPSTANFIARKVAVRFVSDAPPQRLVERMAKSFREHRGDIRHVLITMVSSPEFWQADAVREKTKSPFELTISAIRSLHAKVEQPARLFDWLNRMGQKLYFYQAPTGFPDKGSYWINTGSLLNRMNFGLALAAGKVPGVSFDLLALNDQHEPESAEEALSVYSTLILPERNVEETIRRLTPLLNDPELQKKVNRAASEVAVGDSGGAMKGSEKEEPDDLDINDEGDKGENGRKAPEKSEYTLSQVVGIIIGSPEFQRR